MTSFVDLPRAGTRLAVDLYGAGPVLVLLHGWPHDRHIWSRVTGSLANSHTVIAVDLPGIGASGPAPGYDAATVAGCLDELADEVGYPEYAVMAIDAGGPAAVYAALTQPGRVRAAVLIECALPGLPGAEEFLAGGPPWWFGFHAVPGLAERVLAGHESEYLGYFLDQGVRHGFPEEIRKACIAAYTGEDRLAHGFGYYRTLARSGEQLRQAAGDRRLVAATLAIGSQPVGPTLARQLEPITDRLQARVLPDCGHIVPVDAPDALLEVAVPFLNGQPGMRA